MAMEIDQVAKRSGIPASTLRYYEEKGLICSIGRQGLKRVFNEKILERLALISLAQHSGFSLNEISQMLTPSGADINRAMLRDKAKELDKKIKQLTALKNGLEHAAACKAASHFECPSFLRLLKIAGKVKGKKS